MHANQHWNPWKIIWPFFSSTTTKLLKTLEALIQTLKNFKLSLQLFWLCLTERALREASLRHLCLHFQPKVLKSEGLQINLADFCHAFFLKRAWLFLANCQAGASVSSGVLFLRKHSSKCEAHPTTSCVNEITKPLVLQINMNWQPSAENIAGWGSYDSCWRQSWIVVRFKSTVKKCVFYKV